MTPRPCNCCGLTTHAKSGTCPTCTRSTSWTPAYEDGLYGGHWERDGLTVRWVQVWPDEVQEVAPKGCGAPDYRGYFAHMELEEEVCIDCRALYNEYRRDLRRRRKQSAA